MMIELEKEDLELVDGGYEGFEPIGIWNEWKWPPVRPPVPLEIDPE
jgi:hypothetical protein